MCKRLLTLLAALAMCLHGVRAEERVRFHHMATDTLRLDSIIAAAAAMPAGGDRVVWIASRFAGEPYVGGTLEGPQEQLTVNLDEFDCTTLVETALAINATASSPRRDWREFLFNLERLRYRSGLMTDYASRLHYITEWIADNAHRGHLTETTQLMPRVSYMEKNLDFMSTHADAYPQLADPTLLERIRSVERNFRKVRFPYVKKVDAMSADMQQMLRPGDVIAMVTKTAGLDVTHLAIITRDADGTPRMLHASSKHGRVVLDPLTLTDYLRRSPASTVGIRVFRAVNQ